MKKKLILFLLSCTLASTLIGCDNSEITQLKNISAMEAESKVQAVNLSASDKASQVYTQVSNRKLLDLSTLDSVPNEDLGAVGSFMDKANAQLKGDDTNKVLQDEFISYLLFEMESTPNYWTVSDQQIKGMDATSRSVIVDVTYKSNGAPKPVQLDSKLPLGTKKYDTLAKVRWERWQEVCKAKYRTSSVNPNKYAELREEFVKNYGDPYEIIATQRQDSLAKVMYEKKSVNTYSCMQNTDNAGINATMTVRYVLVPKYTMGVNLGLECKHMYITDYALDSDPTSGMTVSTDKGNDVINDNIDKTLHSYFTAIDEDNHYGLNSLIKDYGKWDKHFDDMFQTTYKKNRGYTISLFSIDGTKIKCGVTLDRSVRAKETKMTLPNYTDRYLFTLELVGDKLQIVEETLLSSKLTGEPQIGSAAAETTGFKSDITLTVADKQAIEKLVGDLGSVQLGKDYSSEKFGETVDLSMASSDLTAVKTSLESAEGVKKATWISSYVQGFSNYASIKTRELYQKEDGSLAEGSASLDFINKGGRWYVYNYALNSLNKLDSTTFSSKNALCISTPTGIEEFNSQATLSTNQTTDADKTPDKGIKE